MVLTYNYDDQRPEKGNFNNIINKIPNKKKQKCIKFFDRDVFPIFNNE